MCVPRRHDLVLNGMSNHIVKDYLNLINPIVELLLITIIVICTWDRYWTEQVTSTVKQIFTKQTRAVFEGVEEEILILDYDKKKW